MSFLDAFNRASPGLVKEFFGQGYPFNWYSVTEGKQSSVTPQNFVAYRTQDLEAYFAQRQAQHERLALRTLQINSWDKNAGIVNFQFTLMRQADDLNSGSKAMQHEATGKGALHCATQKFMVWSMGMQN